jgi:hypothetical protein
VVLEDLPEAYRLFLNRAEGRHNDITVDLELADLPATERMTKLFDTEGSWSLYRDDEGYMVLLSPGALVGKGLWAARYKPGAGRISIRCSDMMLRKSEGPDLLVNPFQYPLDQILLMYILSQRRGFLVHAAGFGFHDGGFIFPGRSGAGKSTLSRQFIDVPGMNFLSDDRVIIRKMENIFTAFGTPWPGDAGIAENRGLPLSGVFFICHGDRNTIKEIRPGEAVKRLLPVTSVPWYDEKTMSDILSLCEELSMNVPAYELHFRPDREVVDFLEKFMSA